MTGSSNTTSFKVIILALFYALFMDAILFTVPLLIGMLMRWITIRNWTGLVIMWIISVVIHVVFSVAQKAQTRAIRDIEEEGGKSDE